MCCSFIQSRYVKFVFCAVCLLFCIVASVPQELLFSWPSIINKYTCIHRLGVHAIPNFLRYHQMESFPILGSFLVHFGDHLRACTGQMSSVNWVSYKWCHKATKLHRMFLKKRNTAITISVLSFQYWLSLFRQQFLC